MLIDLIIGLLLFYRDLLFRATMEPESHVIHRDERIKVIMKDIKKGLY